MIVSTWPTSFHFPSSSCPAGRQFGVLLGQNSMHSTNSTLLSIVVVAHAAKPSQKTTPSNCQFQPLMPHHLPPLLALRCHNDRGFQVSTDGLRQYPSVIHTTNHKKRKVRPTDLVGEFSDWTPAHEDAANGTSVTCFPGGRILTKTA